MVGSGYEDVDLCYRLKKVAGASFAGRGLKLTKKLGLGVLNKVSATVQQDRRLVKVKIVTLSAWHD